jgi:aryl-alcohol dehydrogenase-like predicted oxidoreductase
MEHLEQSLTALDIRLSPEEVLRLEELYQLHPVLGHD